MRSLLRTQYSRKSETSLRLSVTPKAQHSLGSEVSWRVSDVIVLRRPAPLARGTPDAGEEPVVGSWGGHDDLIHLGEAGQPLTSSQRPLPSNAEPVAPPQLPRFWVLSPSPFSCQRSLLPLAPSSSSPLLPSSSPLLTSHSLYFLGSCFLTNSRMS